MNLTFSLSKVWDTGRKCVIIVYQCATTANFNVMSFIFFYSDKKCIKGNKCKLPEGYFHSCVTVLAPRDVLPEW